MKRTVYPKAAKAALLQFWDTGASPNGFTIVC